MTSPISDKYIRKAFSQSEYPINVTDTEGRIMAVNNAYLKLYGFEDMEQVIGKNQRIIRNSSTPKETYETMWKTISQNKVWKGELINQNINGKELPVYLSIYPIFDDEEKIGYMGFTFDRSQQVELEQQLLHSNRLAVLGVLDAGLAHELNNPLTSVSLESENLIDQLHSDTFSKEEAITSVSSIINGVDRMKKVINHLLSYVRKGTNSSDEIIDLRELIEDSLLFLERQLQRKKIHIESNIDSDLFIKGTRIDIESVFHNLISNSRDAFEENDKRIKDPKVVSINYSKPSSNWINITYKDNAGGIPLDVIPKIFEPFFTTKADGKGTGLGLSISNKIIREHGGELRVESSEDTTSFYIGLPLDSKSESNDWLKEL